METKTEQLSVSAEASAVTETKKRTAAKKKATASVTQKESSEAENKTQSRRSTRTTAEKKSTAKKNAPSEKTTEKISEKAEKLSAEEKKTEMSVPVIESVPTPPAEKSAPKSKAKKPVPKKAEAVAVVEKSTEEAKEAEPQEAKKTPEKASEKEKKPTKKQAEKKASADEMQKKSAEKKSDKNSEKKSDKKPEKVVPTEKAEPPKAEKSALKKSSPKKSTPKEKKSTEPKEAEIVPAQLSVEISDPAPEKKSEKDASVDLSIEEKLASMAKKAVPAFIPSFSQNETTEEIDVSGTPRDTFVFYSPSQLAEMERKKETAVEEKAEDSVKEEAVNEEKGERNTEPPAMIQLEATNSAELESENVGTHFVPEKETNEISEMVKRERSERRSASSRRADPHERTVMDKDLARASIYSVLERLGNLERRFLIEEAMKMIPLTDEERTDNHPTSLFNRVRSVVGSMLAEELARGRIIVNGRQLSIPKKEEKVVSEEPIAEAKSFAEIGKQSAERASLEIELDFRTAKEEEVELDTDEDDAHEMQFVSEPRTEGSAEVSLLVTESVEESKEITEDPVTSTPASVPVRESSIRRTRQQRGERRLSSQGSNGSVLLITEEELERVIMNALRRSSATKIDLFAVLKRTYVDAYRLSKEEENRIYTVTENLLQKLVNRGTLQNNDGRYLRKPSQRMLNPGRTPGASFTGNVEARFITELNRQSGDFFEQFAARLLEKYFEMSNIRVDASYVVGGSDDNGIDIMLETTDWLGYKERVFVQAKKRATQPVTLKEVREFYGALCAEEGTRGVFITTSSFCMEASKMIGKLRNLIAIDKRKLFLLAEHCEVGLIRDEEGRLLLDENLFLDYEV